MFIVLEGPDGTGKDTQANLISEKLKEEGYPFISTRDPSGKVANIRALLLGKELEESTRLYLYLAARSELYFKQIKPALESGKIVICNRYDFSTYAYQGQHFSYDDIRKMHTIGGLAQRPDLCLVFISAKPLWQNKQEDVMDMYCQKYRNEIINIYRMLATMEPNVKLIEVDDMTPEQVFKVVWSTLSSSLEGYYEKHNIMRKNG